MRSTNRKKYETAPLSEEDKNAFRDAARSFPNAHLEIIESKEDIKTIGQAGSVNEIVMLEDPELQKMFLHEIVWSKAEEESRAGGLYVKTMELAPPQEAALRLLRLPFFIKIATALGFAKMVASDNAKGYAATPMIGGISVPDNDAAFIEAGRLMERIWLMATASGLSMHILTGVLFMGQRIRANDSNFSAMHSSLIMSAYEKTATIIKAGKNIPALVFRLGKGEPPTSRSIKLSPQINIK
jgi:hypothetical protein